MVEFRLRKRFSLGSVIHRPAWSPAGDMLAAPTRDGSVHVLDLARGDMACVLRPRPDQLHWANAVCWISDRDLVVGYENGSIALLNVPKKSTQTRNHLHRERIEDLSWSQARGLFAAASGDGQVSIWSPPELKPLKSLPHGYWVNAVAWSPDGSSLATGAEDNRVRLWDAPWREGNVVMIHQDWVTDLAWHPTRPLLASTSHSSVQVWEGSVVREVLATRRKDRVRTISFSADGNLLAAKREGGHIEFFETYGWNLISTLEESTFYQDDPTFTPESRAVFHPIQAMICTLGDGHSALRIWDVEYDHQDTWILTPIKQQLIESTARIIDLCALASDIRPTTGRPGIGHNRPPIDEIKDEALSLRIYLQGQPIPKQELAASKSRLEKFVDILSDNTAESMGKALGPAIVAGLLAALYAVLKLLETFIKVVP